MKIGLVTTSHPRMELDFIEEWLTYNTLLGFDRIHVYIDSGYTKPETHGYVYFRKPFLNYHDDLTDE